MHAMCGCGVVLCVVVVDVCVMVVGVYAQYMWLSVGVDDKCGVCVVCVMSSNGCVNTLVCVR